MPTLKCFEAFNLECTIYAVYCKTCGLFMRYECINCHTWYDGDASDQAQEHCACEHPRPEFFGLE